MPQWIFWEPLAQEQLRKIDRAAAMHIFEALGRLREGLGDIKPMMGYHPPARRLKIGAYRVIFRNMGPTFRFLK